MFTSENWTIINQEMHLKILHFSSGLKMSGAVEKLRFTYLWNRYHPQILGVKLISDRCNSHPLMPASTLVSLLKDIWCWKLPYICRVATSENDRLHIYSLWLYVWDFTWLFRFILLSPWYVAADGVQFQHQLEQIGPADIIQQAWKLYGEDPPRRSRADVQQIIYCCWSRFLLFFFFIGKWSPSLYTIFVRFWCKYVFLKYASMIFLQESGWKRKQTST